MEELLWGPDDTVRSALSRGKSYILINSLIGNIYRFAFGPSMMIKSSSKVKSSTFVRSTGTNSETDPLLASHRLSISTFNGLVNTVKQKLRKSYKFVLELMNPPLGGGLLAIILGIIPGISWLLYSKNSFFYVTITQSVETIGALYTALQLFVLGSKLYSRSGNTVPVKPLIFVFVSRFIIIPIASIGTIVFVHKWLPHVWREDPVLEFVLAITPAGPPAITLAAIAEMAGVSSETEGAIAELLVGIYLLTPAMALPVLCTLNMVYSWHLKP